MWRVRGMGVAVRVRQSTLALISLSLSLSLTPKRCSSSTTRRPRFLNSTSFWRRRWVPIDDVDLALAESREGRPLVLLLDEAGEHGHVDGEVPRTRSLKFSKCCSARMVVGARKATCLPEVAALKTGPHGYLGLAVADVAADEPVHGLVALHVRLHLLDAADLVGRLLVGEGRLEGQLPVVVLGEGVALGRPSMGVDPDEALGELLHRGLDLGLARAPRTSSRYGRASAPRPRCRCSAGRNWPARWARRRPRSRRTRP